MNNLVNRDGSIKYLSFIDVDRGDLYTVTGTASTYEGENPFKDSARLALDTVTRFKDGAMKKYSRDALSKRFKNVTEVKHADTLTAPAKPKGKATKDKKIENKQFTIAHARH